MESALERVRGLEREAMLEKVVRENDQVLDRVRAIFRFDRRLPNLSGIFRKNWQVMVNDDKRLLKVFPKPPMICYTRPKNIRDNLCRAKLPPARADLRRREDGFRNCGKGCKLCSFTGEETNGGGVIRSVRISNTGEDYPVKGKLQCGSKNFLYILTCRKCERTAPNDAQYGGESGQTAVKRFSQHHGTITQACHEFSNTPVGEHFRQNGHSAADCVFTPVEEINGNIFVRKARERRMISSLNLIEHGMNRKL